MSLDDELLTEYETSAAAWNVMTAALLQDFESWARARGADEEQILRLRDVFAAMLRASRSTNLQ